MEDDVLCIVSEPDNRSQFVNRFSCGNFNVHPCCLTRLKGGLFAGTVADTNFGNIDRPVFFGGVVDVRAVAEILAGNGIRFVNREHFSVFEQHRAVADFGNGFEIV